MSQCQPLCTYGMGPFTVQKFDVINSLANLPFEPRRSILTHIPDDKILALSKLKGFVDDNLNGSLIIRFVFQRGRKDCGKRTKPCLPAISPVDLDYAKCVQRSFPRGVKSRLFWSKGLTCSTSHLKI